MFRNDYAHHTIDDITILRQWRTNLIQDSSPKDSQINSASITILNKVIEHLSGPQSKPLQSKYHTKPKVVQMEDGNFSGRDGGRKIYNPVVKEKKSNKKGRRIKDRKK